MRLLWIATKPPWPPIDGGRLLQWLTLEALAAAGTEVTLVAPADPGGDPAAAAELARRCVPRLVTARPRGRLAAWLGRGPLAIARHRLGPVAAEVERLLAAAERDGEEPFTAVHVEQVHALAQAAPARRRGLPVVLRAQNVESALWDGVAGLGGVRGRLAAREAERLAAWEGRAVAGVAATAALTAGDAERLRRLAARHAVDQPAARVEVVPAPFPPELPAAERPLPGKPALVLLGGGGWLPNAEAVRWFVAEAWPRVRRAVPGARLHLFGAAARAGSGVESHPAPADSRQVFAPGSVLLVPVRIASGVRMKILEAWARGVPVVATPAAAAGLDAADGRELLLAEADADFARALWRLSAEPGLAATLVAGGRAALGRHRPAAVAERLLALYGVAAGSPSGAAS